MHNNNFRYDDYCFVDDAVYRSSFSSNFSTKSMYERGEKPVFEDKIGSDTFFKSIEKGLPPVFTRQTASQVLGGLISVKTLSNLDALGEGPSKKIKFGSRVGYERESFMKWLRKKLSTN